MARRRNPGAFDALFDLAALLPRWLDVALAGVFYLLLHRVASREVVLAVGPAQAADAVTGAIWKGLATGGQYLLPFVFLLGAMASALRRHKRRALVETAAQGQAAAAVLDGMSWREFEVLVGEAFRLQGWQVEETGGGGADGGVDLVLRRDGETHLVQCKQWRAYKVGVQVVRELYGVMAARGAAGGFVVTSGRFTDEAVAFAGGRNVMLVDGPRLLGLIRQAQAARTGAAAGRGGRAAAAPAAPVSVPVTSAPVVPAAAASAGLASAAPVPAVAVPPAVAASAVATPGVATPPAEPACPVCSRPMVRRVARRGAYAGSAFWGCTGYPACRGTRSMQA